MSENISKEKFQKRLQQLIDNKNLKQKDLAAEMDVTSATVSSWLKQKTVPTKKHLRRLSDYFSVTDDYLKGLTDFPTYAICEDPDTGEKCARKLLGIPKSEAAVNIHSFINDLSYKEERFLYAILEITKKFDIDEWRSLYVIVLTLWQCRHSHVTLYNPLSNFENFKRFFYKTDACLAKLLTNSELNRFKNFTTINRKIKDFEAALEDDFQSMKNIFKSIECLKSSLPHTNQCIHEIIEYFENPETHEYNFINEETCKYYSDKVKETYETDLKNMVTLFTN